MRKRIVSMVLTVMMIVTMLQVTALAQEDNTFSDIANHWAESVILKKQMKGLVEGMSDGMFKPDDSLTNAQLITLVNRFLGLTKSKDNQFTDIKGDEWYVGEADKAEYYSYVDKAVLNGDNPVLRIDMLCILDCLIHVEESNVVAPFDDLEGLSSEELDIVNRFYAHGYLEGDGQGKAMLGERLTRAEMLTFFDNTLGYIVLTQDDVANMPENGKVTIIGQNIVIEDSIIEELYISLGVYGNVTVKNTVLRNVTLGGEGTDGAIDFENVMVSGRLVVQDGSVDLIDTNIKTVIISGESEINTDKGTSIKKLKINAPVKITGDGRIIEADITVSGAEIEKRPTYYEVAKGTGVDIAGTEITYRNDRPRLSSRPSGSSTTSDVTAPMIKTYSPADNATDIAQITAKFMMTFNEDVIKGTGDIVIKKSADDSTVWTISIDDVSINGSLVTISLPSGGSLEYSTGYYIEIPNTGFRDNKGNLFAGITGSSIWNFTTCVPTQGTQVSYNATGGVWEVDEAGSATGIWKIEDLALIGSDITNDDSSVWELADDYVLMTDLDFDVATSYRDADTNQSTYTTGSGFVPIGDGPTKFRGSFDGNNNTIANLLINRAGDSNIGLFGYAEAATIKNIGIKDVEVAGYAGVGGLIGVAYTCEITSSYVTGNISGYRSVGGLAGMMSTGSTLTKSYTVGSVTVSDGNVGGLVGSSNGSTITNSYATSDVVGSNDKVGGLVGTINGNSITNSYAIGSVTGGNSVGGLVGVASGTAITNSIAFNPSVSGGANVSRVVGMAISITPTGSYANEAMTGTNLTSIIGGGTANNIDGEDMTTGAFKLSSSAPYSGNWDFTDIWGIKDSADRPTLRGIGDDSGINPDVTAPTITDYSPTDDAVDIAQTTASFTATFSEDIVKGTGNIIIKKSSDDSTVWTISVDDVSISGSIVTISLPLGTNLEYSTGYYIEIPNTGFKDTGGNVFAGVADSSTWNFTTSISVSAQGTQVSYNATDGVWEVDEAGSATGIWKIEDLALIGSDTTNDDSSVWELADDYVLMMDLDFDVDISYRDADTNQSTYTTGSGFAPIGDGPNKFIGSFDGNNNTIANLLINRSSSSSIGLFGYVKDATIKNIGMTDVEVTGYAGVGGLIGSAYTCEITSSYVTGNILGYRNVGGLAGIISSGSTLTKSYTVGSVTVSDGNVGGLVGLSNDSTITNSYATSDVVGSNNKVGGLVGSINGNSIEDSYAIGSVTGDDRVGGLVGIASGTAITNSIAFNPSVSGGANVSRVVGMAITITPTGSYANEAMTGTNLTSIIGGATANNIDGEDMTAGAFKLSSSAPYSGNWDFTDIWEIKDSADRPTLRGIGDDSGV